MVVYNVTNPDSPFTAVESAPVSEGNLTFFYISNSGKTDAARKQLHEMGQHIVSETPADGCTILVTRGSQTKDELIRSLKEAGGDIAERQPVHKTNWWAFRGNLSNAGQALQLISALKEPRPSEKNNFKKPKYAADQGLFAILNLAANFVNIIFGAEKEKDPYRLLYIKENQNKLLEGDLKGMAPDMSESHAAIRKDPKPPPGLGKRFYSFMRKHSVSVGEIGLRYLGSMALVFPAKKAHWKNVGAAYKVGGIKAALPATLNKSDNYNLASGITYLVGKTLALFSKVPDPYNPKPPGTLDRIREKYFFRTATGIETGAAAALVYGNMKKDKPLGAAGGTLFMGAFSTRFFAPFGNREVDKEEVFAYTSDQLAEVPHDKLPQRVAESAAQLSKDLSDDPSLTFGSIYTRLATDLYKYHDIALDSPEKKGGEKLHEANTHDKKIPDRKETGDVPPYTVPDEQAAFRNSASRMPGKAMPAAGNFTDKVNRTGAENTQQI